MRPQAVANSVLRWPWPSCESLRQEFESLAWATRGRSVTNALIGAGMLGLLTQLGAPERPMRRSLAASASEGLAEYHELSSSPG
jgi:hypothetical protein